MILFFGFLIVIPSAVLANAEIKTIEEELIDETYTRPTFGLDHYYNKPIVKEGFRINEKYFDITNNYHTPFPIQLIKVGEVNSFEATIYSEKGVRVQEFLFGIPSLGNSHLAELGVEIWYDIFGQIDDVKVIQKSNVVDASSLNATHTKTKCTPRDWEENCDKTKISMVFLEPLRDKVMAIKAIDFKNRYQITYLNEGINVWGEQINPLPTVMIPSPVKYEGLIPVTQIEKYSKYWISEKGGIFERNKFDSFSLINYDFDRFHDKGNAFSRLHSEFGKIIAYEQKRALNVFDSKTLISELPQSVTIDNPIGERITNEVKVQMLWEQYKAHKTLENTIEETRYY